MVSTFATLSRLKLGAAIRAVNCAPGGLG